MDLRLRLTSQAYKALYAWLVRDPRENIKRSTSSPSQEHPLEFVIPAEPTANRTDPALPKKKDE